MSWKKEIEDKIDRINDDLITLNAWKMSEDTCKRLKENINPWRSKIDTETRDAAVKTAKEETLRELQIVPCRNCKYFFSMAKVYKKNHHDTYLCEHCYGEEAKDPSFERFEWKKINIDNEGRIL